MQNLENLRRAAKRYDAISDWLSHEPGPRSCDRNLWSAARAISGLGRELWTVRVWAAIQAARFIANKIGGGTSCNIAGTLCWLAQHGSGGGWTNAGEGTTRCIPSEFLDVVYTFACVATDAANAPRFAPAPLYRRNALGGHVWDAAFNAASNEFDAFVEDGLDEIVNLDSDAARLYRECARRGKYILLTRKMKEIARNAVESPPTPERWDVEEVSPALWRPVRRDDGKFETYEEASQEASFLSDEALRTVEAASAEARRLLGLD